MKTDSLVHVNYQIPDHLRNRWTGNLNSYFEYVLDWGGKKCGTHRMNSANRWGTGVSHYIPETRDEIRRIWDRDTANRVQSQAPLEEGESEGGENEDDDNSYSNTSQSMGEDDSQMYDRDQDFSDTLHGGKYTSGADQYRYPGAGTYGGEDTSRSDSPRYPEYIPEMDIYGQRLG